MSVELIYKTRSPKAIEWWLAAAERVQADRRARSAYEDRMTEEFGVPDLPQYTEEERRTRRKLWLRGARVSGLDSGYDEQPPADSGWRLDSKDRYWKPKLATKAGKGRAAELAALCTYDMRDHTDEIGVASMAFAGSYLYRSGMDYDEAEGALYVVWGSGQCAKEAEAVQAKVPDVVWVEVPRSEWYAREEAKETPADV